MGLLETLFPRVRAEVLRILFAEPGPEVHQRELARQIGLSLKTVQNVMTREKLFLKGSADELERLG